MMKPQLLIFILLICISISELSAQSSTSTIKGQITDKGSEIPLIGATVELADTENTQGTTTDIDGYFSIANVEVGRHILRFSYLGYEAVTVPEVLVTSGKDFIINVSLVESTVVMDEVVVTADADKGKAINDLTSISARSFSLEEVTRFSGGRNDASRMAANFAGVLINNDSRNDLIIRGNSPSGVLWRLEGVPIPNPNHFSTLGSTGGPVSALNTNMLSNSDFLTGAFPAEYGNATAGVFDIQFRSGNKDKYEFTIQNAVFSGTELMAEGPINKSSKSSFLVGYRRSFVALAQSAGLNVGTTATPIYQDLSFKIDFGKSKMGKFTLFGIAANSNIDFLGDNIDPDDFFADNTKNSYAASEIGVVGLTHRFLIDNNSYIRTIFSANTAKNDYQEFNLQEGLEPNLSLDISDRTSRFTLNSIYNRKISAKHTLRVGFINEYYLLDNLGRTLETDEWVDFRDFKGGMNLAQVYVQSKYKLNSRLTANIGLHSQYLDFNDDYAIEPRLGLNYKLSERQTLSMGVGVHEQILPLPVYLQTSLSEAGTYLSNKDVNFSRSTHFIVGYDQNFKGSWRLKTEAYYQYLNDIPVLEDPGPFSLLNLGDEFGFPNTENLTNEGTGYNYGFEFTVEKFFSDGYYGLITGSIFDSKYTGSDDITRNTAFNNNYILNVLAGKEFLVGKEKRNAITFDMKFTNAGGRYYTPIDLDRSRQFQTEIRDLENAYSERFPAYIRLDLKVGYRLNSRRKRFSQQFYLDFQNVSNHKNVFLQRYNVASEKIGTIYQIGFFPDLLYRIQF